jgi:DNA modification methylase
MRSEAPTTDAEPQTDRAAELLEKWGVKPGDLWQIGEHRLVCGDCTDAATVARVMGGEKAALMISDPPYNVGYEYDGATDDQKHREEYAAFCERYLALGKDVSVMQVITPGKANERLYSPDEWMTWFKGFGLSRGHYFKAMVTEPILLFGEKPKNKFYATDHFDIPTDREPGLRDLHACPKPVGLFAALIEPMTEPTDTVYEAFSGSGTTLVACENLRRRCRAIEISPAYVAVALERMATAFPALDIHRLDA